MKRFWKNVTFEPSTFGYAIRLDDRAVKTPLKHELILPTKKLANAVIAEWDMVEEKIEPQQMPMTGFANAAIDRVAVERSTFVEAIAAYGETDQFCYRAEAGEALAIRQAEIWDPWLTWAQDRYDVSFRLVEGVMHRPQPVATVAKLKAAVSARGTFELAAMAKLTHLSGSLIATLALLEHAGDAASLWDASILDELWQEELWGADFWAEKNRTDRKSDFMNAARFLENLSVA
jgi:chaperone required for assembly of F1-ATPase